MLSRHLRARPFRVVVVGAARSIEVGEDPIEHAREHVDIPAGQMVEEVAAGGCHVIGRGAFDRGPAGGCHAHQRAAAVLGALLAGDEAALLHAGELM